MPVHGPGTELWGTSGRERMQYQAEVFLGKNLVSPAYAISSILYFSLNLSVFANCWSQFLLDHLGKCLKLFVSTDSTSCHDFASQSAYNFFIREKHPKPRGNRAITASVYFNGQRPALSPAERAVAVGRHRIAITCTAVTAAVCVCVCMRASVRDVFAIYDKNIFANDNLIIKIIILYFIQIRHTDDFPLTGKPASNYKCLNSI